MTDLVTIERVDGVAVLRLNREDALNAITLDLARGVAAALIDLDSDDSVRGIVLSGTGTRAFCAGVDLR